MIHTILFIENKPNSDSLYPGCFWIMSFDCNGNQVMDENWQCVGNYKFHYNERDTAEAKLKELKEQQPLAEVEYLEKEKPQNLVKEKR